MASRKTSPQPYPRVNDEARRDYSLLDDSQLKSHPGKIAPATMRKLIRSAIYNANKKSSRVILKLTDNASQEEVGAVYAKEGRELFKYFHKYCGDPASTAHQVYKKHYTDIGREQFRNRTLQKERMNSGWRYQYLAIDAATCSNRFKSVSDIGAAEADFNAIIEFQDRTRYPDPLSLYVSVKNRRNTMGGQDWPKAIHALENVAKTDKNRRGPYCCVFGITMDSGGRHIKYNQKTSAPYSVNTEVWLSDYFWPFFANYSYEEIMTFVLDELIETEEPERISVYIEIPTILLDAFGKACQEAGLLDEEGYFNDRHQPVRFFCNKLPRMGKRL